MVDFIARNEHEIIQLISKKKMFKHKIPYGAKIWSWWKRYFLENEEFRTLLLSKEELSKDYFTDRIMQCSKFFPNHLRGNQRKILDFIKELYVYYCYTLSPSLPFESLIYPNKGLGLFVKQEERIEFGKILFPNQLWGIIFYIDYKVFMELQKYHYPSLYINNGNPAILCGALSLINHSCSSKLGFTKPITDVPDNLEDFFSGCHIIKIKAVKDTTIKKEIFSWYSDNLGFKCNCSTCIGE